jgi:hypothetical protein
MKDRLGLPSGFQNGGKGGIPTLTKLPLRFGAEVA